MSGTDKRKQSLYFPESMLQDIQKEAARLDRSLSWIVQRCVKIGLPDIRKLPSVNEIGERHGFDSAPWGMIVMLVLGFAAGPRRQDVILLRH